MSNEHQVSHTLRVFYELLNFDSMHKLYGGKRIPIPFPDDGDAWVDVLSRQLLLKGVATDKTDQLYYVLLEFVKRGSKNGYVLLSIPVVIDVPDLTQPYVYLLPNIAESIHLNGDYYLGEHNPETPELQLNDTPLLLSDLTCARSAGTAQTWFCTAREFLYKSCNVSSLQALVDKVQAQLKGQEIVPRLSLVAKPDGAAKKQLLNLYEGLLTDGPHTYNETALPKLLAAYEFKENAVTCRKEDLYEGYLQTAAGKYDPAMPYLLGHMDTQTSSESPIAVAKSRELFPLDNTQRHAALATAYLDTTYGDDTDYGRVLAVNGPPGSGKTSMLKAVVAHYVVKAALLEEPCPIIVASGATNQAVKNVTSAFPDVVQDDNAEGLFEYQRWVPHCPTYGSYFASTSAIKQLSEQEKKVIPLLSTAGVEAPYNYAWDGVGAQLNELQYNDKLVNYYLSKARCFFKQIAMPDPSTVEAAVASLHRLLSATYKQMADALHTAKVQLSSPNANLDKVFPIENDMHHLANFVEIRKALIDLYQDHPHDYEKINKIYERVCRELIRDESLHPMDYRTRLRKTALNILIEQCVDLEYRTKLFHLAARYWEGKFIIDQVTSLHFSRTEENVLAGLRRVCMITPVIISTVNRLPSLLKINSYLPGSIQRDFAYGGIDLLITDESGQATIMGALPLAGLTKRLVSVGDVSQLAPVINTKEDVSAFDEYLIWLSRGHSLQQVTDIFRHQLCVATGSFLHVVQAASSLNYDGKGFMLRGHYRCYQNIIDYCNKLVYDNKLFYMPFLNKNLQDKGLPAMAYVESTGISSKGGDNTSKQNKDEAEMIAQLVVESYQHWQKTILEEGANKLRLQDMLAIVTPFNQQPKVILEALLQENLAQDTPIPEADIRNTVINTIHTLQGAERDIIIYSGVQSHEDSGTLFFENQPYLLNVAVSRAKKSFIAFLSPTLYRLNDTAIIDKPDFQSSNSVHYLGWYMANHGVRMFPHYLFIVEAPGKVESLKRILKSDFLVHATGGAITNMDLEDASVETASQQLRPHYKLLPNGEKTLDVIIAQGPRIKKIYIATDDDNVGETIAWHLQHAIKQRAPELLHKVERIALRAITNQDVKQAIECPKKIDQNKVAAEVARQVIDRWLAQYMWTLLAEHLPNSHPGRQGMGRVKAIILDLIAQHEARVRQQKLSTLTVTLMVNGRKVKGQIKHVPTNYLEKVQSLIQETGKPITATSQNYKLVNIEKDTMACPPFNRSTFDIMSLAWQKYRMTPATTMRILQQLYEGEVL